MVWIPQILTNVRTGSTNGLDFDFVMFWTLADGILLSCMREKNAETYVLISILVKLVFDIVLASQYFYLEIADDTRIISNIQSDTKTNAAKCLVSLVILVVSKFVIQLNQAYVDICMWCITALFLVACLIQIVKNYKSKQVDGMSWKTFIMLLCSNGLIAALIIEVLVDNSRLSMYIQLLLGLCMSSVLDIVILVQYYIYIGHYGYTVIN
jgi:hypothetical protein